MKKQYKTLITIVMISFMVFAIIPNFFTFPSTIQTTTNFDIVDNQEPEPKTSQFIPRTIRVAIFNEPNITVPKYAVPGNPFLNNNYTGLLQLLQGAGYQVDELTHDDISNHKLMTAAYDVFIMVDNLPKYNIANYIKEFWLGGGAILSFDSAILFLCYFGILCPESEGNHGAGTYYSYGSLSHNISSRHPVTKDYQINDKFASIYSSVYLIWNYLLGTSVGAEAVRFANIDGYMNQASGVAIERDDKGGRLVQLPGRGGEIGTNMSNLIIDAIDWLCPRPKERILFDLSHMNGFGVDSYDYSNGYTYYGGASSIYSELRDNLVNRSYTFDKLYPSASGNLTTNNLAPYDMLIINLPETNFTALEVTSVMNWVSNGGGLLALGESYFQPGTKNLNYLLSSTGLSVIDTGGGLYTLSTSFEHPTAEGCTSLEMTDADEVTNASNAFPLWGASTSEICIAGEEYGNGRIILSSDWLLSDDRIGDANNRQFGINAANWLTASKAEVLVFIANPSATDPNDNVYRGPVATALNDLKIPFYLTVTPEYLNLSLSQNTWKFLIIDNDGINVFNLDIEIINNILDHLKNGGYFIVSTFAYTGTMAKNLWDYMGFEYVGGTSITPPDIYIWDNVHSIFNNPAPYQADNLTTSWNYVGTEWCNVTLHNNATAIAGVSPTSQVHGGTIIIGANGRTIANTMLLTPYYDDTDDSTYPDALEIWENEIAYITYQSLSVHINTPYNGDIFDATAPSYSITTDGIIIDETYYTINDAGHYPITSTSGTISQSAWEALSDGTISLKVYVEDTAGSSKYAAVNIDKDTQAPIIDIIAPTSGQVINTTTAPSFIVNITDDHLDKMWYTVDLGLTNFSFITNGTINQAAWNNLTEGTITIGFYANDTLGHEAFKQVSITYELPPSGGGGRIPGYNGYLIIGIICVISVLILEKKLRRFKLKN